MNVGAIDSSRIQAMMAQLKAAATRGPEALPAAPVAGSECTAKVTFADALKTTLDSVSGAKD